jgi:hypothetical protein
MAPGLSVSALSCWSVLESVFLGYCKLGSGWRPFVDVWWLLYAVVDLLLVCCKDLVRLASLYPCYGSQQPG